MNYKKIISDAKHYVTYLLNCNLDNTLEFHNIHHTINVVEMATKMANFYKLTEEEKAILITSAWFHDAGYTISTTNHEDESIALLKAFYSTRDVSKSFIEKCCQCIEATKIGAKPKDYLESMLKDADYAHIVSNEYWILVDRLKNETEHTQNKINGQKLWFADNLKFLMSIEFYTNFYDIHFKNKREDRIKENQIILNSMTRLVA